MITCPICGKETFNTVGRCKCGYEFPYDPIQDEMVMDICSNCRKIRQCRNGDHIGGGYTICPSCNAGILTILSSFDQWNKMTKGEKEEAISMVPKKKLNVGKPIAVKCPYCSSTNTSKISGIRRRVSIGLFGLGSSKIGKQWHCNNCNSNF